jgi:hypothetical protein
MLRPRRVLRHRTNTRAAVADGAGESPAEQQAAEDAIEQVRQLGELREQGILTEEEFVAEKRRVLEL